MRVLVVDDERLARKELISLLSQNDNIEILGEAPNVDEAKEKIESLQPDVVF
ncbi:two-component system, regulatory protein [Winogradskyella psychrotolerans RS-3]|nr:two-component system, regulatory protein [Winogradskyella psychrotolerans RS-3]